MPYIDKNDRDHLSRGQRPPVTPGEVNYTIINLILEFIAKEYETPNYEAYNEAIGILECAKLELYRRAVASYEDSKRDENGDVF